MLVRSVVSAAMVGLLFCVASPSYGAPTKKPPAERSAKSKECSVAADAKGLHGKPRKRFRSACMRGKPS